MSYQGPISHDWCGYLLTLKEVLEDVLMRMDEDERMNVRPDISCLEAYDILEQHMSAVKRDIGI